MPATAIATDDDRILTFEEWCEINSLSRSLGQKILRLGHGPVITQLSERRIGITVANNRVWQAARARLA